MQDFLPAVIEYYDGIQRRRLVILQEGDAYGHTEFLRQVTERPDKRTVFADGKLLQFPFILRENIAVVPHFGEQCDIRAFGLCFSTGLFSVFQLFFGTLSWKKLKERDPECHVSLLVR